METTLVVRPSRPHAGGDAWNAVMITDTAFFRNPNYHEVTDTPDTLDYERMAQVVTRVDAAMTTP